MKKFRSKEISKIPIWVWILIFILLLQIVKLANRNDLFNKEPFTPERTEDQKKETLKKLEKNLNDKR